MRTPSQTFADEWQAKQYDSCLNIVGQHGPSQTKALFWIAYSGHAPQAWLDKIKHENFSIEQRIEALSLLMCQVSSSAKTELMETLMAGVDTQDIEKYHLFHRASQANCVESLTFLQEKHPSFDLNTSLNDKGLTPLALALRHMRLNTSVYLCKRGADEHYNLKHPVLGKSITVYALARNDNMHKLEEFKQFHQAVKDKSSIEKALEEKKSKGKKSKKKM